MLLGRRYSHADFARAGMDIGLRRGRFLGLERLFLCLDGGVVQRRAEHQAPGQVKPTYGKQEGNPDSHEIAEMQAGEKAGLAVFHSAFIPYCGREVTDKAGVPMRGTRVGD